MAGQYWVLSWKDGTLCYKSYRGKRSTPSRRPMLLQLLISQNNPSTGSQRVGAQHHLWNKEKKRLRTGRPVLIPSLLTLPLTLLPTFQRGLFLATNVSLLPNFPKFLKAYLYRCLSRTYFEIVDFFRKYRNPQQSWHLFCELVLSRVRKINKHTKNKAHLDQIQFWPHTIIATFYVFP